MHILATAPVAGAITLGGVLAIVGIVIYAFRRFQRTHRTAAHLVELAVSGRADEARILARSASAELAPVLDALVGDVSPPRGRPIITDVLLAAALFVPAGGLLFYAVFTKPEERWSDAGALLLGTGVLLPATLAGAAAVFALGRHAGRLVRGSCVTLLAKNVRQAVDGENAEALRRATPAKDPRGE